MVDKEMKKWMLKREDVKNKRKEKAAKNVDEKLNKVKAKGDEVKTSQEKAVNVDDDKAENVEIKDSAPSDFKEEE